MAVIGQLTHAEAVVASDSRPLRHPSRCLSFTDATGGPGMGTVYVDTVGGETNVAITLPAGLWPIAATKVYSTGLAASNLVSYWGP